MLQAQRYHTVSPVNFAFYTTCKGRAKHGILYSQQMTIWQQMTTLLLILPTVEEQKPESSLLSPGFESEVDITRREWTHSYSSWPLNRVSLTCLKPIDWLNMSIRKFAQNMGVCRICIPLLFQNIGSMRIRGQWVIDNYFAVFCCLIDRACLASSMSAQDVKMGRPLSCS